MSIYADMLIEIPGHLPGAIGRADTGCGSASIRRDSACAAVAQRCHGMQCGRLSREA
jgi:hypothetical protein